MVSPGHHHLAFYNIMDAIVVILYMAGQNIIHGWSEYYIWVVRILGGQNIIYCQNTLPPSLCSSASCKEHFFQPDLQNTKILTNIQKYVNTGKYHKYASATRRNMKTS